MRFCFVFFSILVVKGVTPAFKNEKKHFKTIPPSIPKTSASAACIIPSPSPMDPFPPFSSMRLAIFLTTILYFCCTVSFSATTSTTTSCISSVALLSVSDAAWTGPSTISFCCFPDDILLLPSSSFSGDHVEIRRMMVTTGPFCIEHLVVVVVHGASLCFAYSCRRCDVEIWRRISATSLYLPPPPFHPDHHSGTPGAMLPPAIMRLKSRDGILEDLAMKLLILSTRAPTFGFYKRADQWPRGVCVASPRQCVLPVLPTHFTLHGLWPSNKGGKKKQPNFCPSSSPFDIKQIDDLMPRLKYGWPSLFKPNDEFWEHEWYKHGTCSSLQEHDYFKLALDVFEQHNLTSILEDAGVTPGPTASYPAQKFTDAIQSKIGVNPDLRCIGKYLVEIRLCLDVTAIAYQQCPPQGVSQRCPTVDILFVA